MAPDALWFSRGSAVGLEVCDGSSEAAPRQDARGRAARSSRPAARLLPGRSPSRSISSITGSCRTISSSAAASPTGCISRTEPRGGRYLRHRDRPAARRKEGPAVHRAAARHLQADLQRPRLGRHGRRDHGRVAAPREGVWTRSLRPDYDRRSTTVARKAGSATSFTQAALRISNPLLSLVQRN